MSASFLGAGGASIGVEAAFAPPPSSAGHFVGSSIGVEAAFANVSPMQAGGPGGGSTLLPAAGPGASIGVEAAFANVAPQGGSVNLLPSSDARDFWGTSIGVEAAFADAKGGRLPSGASAMVAAAGAPYGGASVDVNGAFAEYSPFSVGPLAGPQQAHSGMVPVASSATQSAAGNSISVQEQRIMDDMTSTPRRLASFRRPEGAVVAASNLLSEVGSLAAAIRGPGRFGPQPTASGHAMEAVQAERLVLPDPRFIKQIVEVPSTYGYPAGPQRYPMIAPGSVQPPPVAAPVSGATEYLQYAYHAPNLRFEAKNAQAVPIPAKNAQAVPLPVMGATVGRAIAASGPSASPGIAAHLVPAAPAYAAPPPAVYSLPPQFMPFAGHASASQAAGMTALVSSGAGPGRTYTSPATAAPVYTAPVAVVPPAKAATYTPPMTSVQQAGGSQSGQHLTAAPPPTATYSRPTGLSGTQTPSYTAPSKSTYVPPPTYAVTQHMTAVPTQFAIANVPSYRGPPVTSPMAPWRDFRPS